MAEERYEPVSCDYHDLLEEAAMHKKRIELEFELDGGPATFIAVHGRAVITGSATPWALVLALVAAFAVAAILLRIAALLAARDLFGAFMAVTSVGAAVVSLASVVLLQVRIVGLA